MATYNTPADPSDVQFYLRSRRPDFENRLRDWVEFSDKAGPAYSAYSRFSGVEHVSLLMKLVALSRFENQASVGADLQALTESVNKTISGYSAIYRTVAIVAALLLVLLFPAILNPIVGTSPSYYDDSRFSHNQLTTFQVFYYLLLNLSIAIAAYLVINSIRKSIEVGIWLSSFHAKLNYLYESNDLSKYYGLLALAIFLFLASIPFNFAVVGTPNGALALFILWVLAGIFYILCYVSDSHKILWQLREDARDLLNASTNPGVVASDPLIQESEAGVDPSAAPVGATSVPVHDGRLKATPAFYRY